MKKKQTLSILFIIIFGGIISAFSLYDDENDFEIAKNFDLFHDIVKEVRMYYVDDVNIPKLIKESTKEFLTKLDPYTIFYPEDKMEEYKLMTTGAYGGIGALIIKRKNTLLITDVKQGAPADSFGLKVGDAIVAVNGISLNAKNIQEIQSNLKGQPGSLLKLDIKRYGQNNIISKQIERKKISESLIPYFDILKNDYGYIKLRSFRKGASAEFKQKLKALNSEQKLGGLIIDLRQNPGGLLGEAVEIVNLFVPKGSDVVSVKGRVKSRNHDYKATKNPLYPNLPLVVLIDNRSASASEIVAGALQDLDRAVIMGERSFGKGLVQITRKTQYNTRIKITTAKYYISSGRCIQSRDYLHRNPDGSAGKVPDSLISEFKTKNGRKVYDSGGIEPDILQKEDTLSMFTKALLRKFVILDFCTQFYYNNTLSDYDNFSISDKIYRDFIEFAKKQKIDYATQSEKIAQKLAEIAQEEQYEQSLINKIEELQNDLVLNEEETLMRYKREISSILHKEIVKRYFYDKGLNAVNIKTDKLIKAAENMLSDTTKYQNILTEIKN